MVIGRNTQGVRIIRTADDEHVVALQRIDEIEEDAMLEGEVDEAQDSESSHTIASTEDSNKEAAAADDIGDDD